MTSTFYISLRALQQLDESHNIRPVMSKRKKHTNKKNSSGIENEDQIKLNDERGGKKRKRKNPPKIFSHHVVADGDLGAQSSPACAELQRTVKKRKMKLFSTGQHILETIFN